MISMNTPVWQLTVGELVEAIGAAAVTPMAVQDEPVACDKNIVHGISGVAALLGVSKTMVQKYRKQGWIEPAIQQRGRKIICNAPLAIELFGKRK
jgi:hypothetical protein